MAAFLSGKSRLIGRSTIYSTPISLDPAAYKGAMVGGDNGVPYYSDGTEWVATVDSARTSQIVTAALTVGGTANAVTITTGLELIALSTGFRFWFVPTAANTGASTINVDGLGAAAVKTIGSRADTPANYFRMGIVTEVVWDGTNFIADRETEIITNANGRAVLYANGAIDMFHSMAVDLTTTGVTASPLPVNMVNNASGLAQKASFNTGLVSIAVITGSFASTSTFVVQSNGTGSDAEARVSAYAAGSWYPGGAIQ